jgi:hypothetical protein
MTAVVMFADSVDAEVRSSSNSYASALVGSNRVVAGSSLTVGQRFPGVGASYSLYQSGLEFSYTHDSGLVVVSPYLRLRNNFTQGTTSRNIEVGEFDFDASITAADWRTPSQLSGLFTPARLVNAHLLSSSSIFRMGLEVGLPDASIELRYWLFSSRNRTQATPTGNEYNNIFATEATGTASDPALYYTTAPVSDLFGVLGAQIQLSDGTHAFLELDADSHGSGTNILLRHHDGSTTTTIATLTIADSGGSSSAFAHPDVEGAQGMTLVTDNADNLYVVGVRNNSPNDIAAQAYAKGSGHSWTARTFRSSATSTNYTGHINNLAVAWHDVGTSGTIMAVISHHAGSNLGNDSAYLLLNCDHLLNGTGGLIRGSGAAAGNVIFSSGHTGFNSFTNETGSMLDVAAAPGAAGVGYAISTHRGTELGDTGAGSVCKYTLASDGSKILSADRSATWPVAPSGTKDANAKYRVIGVSATRYVAVWADPLPGFGLTVSLNEQPGGTAFNNLAVVHLEAEGITSMPAGSAVATALNWDAAYNPVDNKLWVYYFDQADNRRLMRTSINLSTGLANQDEQQVQAAVGGAGSTNHAIRVHRGTAAGSRVLVVVANETSGGVHSTVYIVDSLNAPPTEPTLTPKTNFSANNSALFEWEFNDPDAGDSQSAYQLQVNTSLGASAVDTGKIVDTDENHTLAASALSNPGDWQWRVRTWDALDIEGPYSEFGTFQTSASGTVTIIDPAADNPDGVTTAEYLIAWVVTDTTQAEYRVVVVRTDTAAELVDTDWVASTDTTYLVEGMETEVEYEIQLTIRNGAVVETNTATRLITPNYSNPVTPTIVVTPVNSDGYTEVAVGNPPPGDVLATTADGTFETAEVSDWEVNGGSLVASSAQAFEGIWSGLITVSGGPSETTVRATLANKVAAIAGRQYTVNYHAYSPDGYDDLGQAIAWLDSGDNVLSTSQNTSPIVSAAWTERSSTFYAPPDTQAAIYGPTLADNPPNGTVLYVDNLDLFDASDQPTPSTNEIYRRVSGTTGLFHLLGEADPNGSFRDYTALSGVTYEYKAKAIAGERSAESATATGTLQLQGVWLHDPLDPGGTIYQFPFGKASRATDNEISQGLQHFAGREDPVADHGEHRTHTYRISSFVPFGDDYAAGLAAAVGFAEARRTLVLRDNRGRGAAGAVSRYTETDREAGTDISYAFTRIDSDEVI